MNEQPETTTNSTNTGLLIGLVVALIVVAILAFLLFSQRNDNSAQPSETAPVAPVASATPTPAVVATVAPTREEAATVAPTVAPPVAVITAPSEGIVDAPVFFSAAESASALQIVAFAWEFGDGTTADTVEVEKTYSAPGVYLVNLALVDEAGGTAAAQHQITIADAASEQMPVDAVAELEITDELINITVDGQPAAVTIVAGIPNFEARVGQVVRMDGTPVSEAFAGLDMTWTMGDGSPPVAGTVVEHTYTAPGIYEIAIAASTGEISGSRLYQVGVSE